MSTFPGSNLNIISGIDPIGAGFLGGEVQRLQSDTENKRNTETARRGQDQQMQLEQQQMAQQAQQQQAAMAQQQAMFEKTQEATRTENNLARLHTSNLAAWQEGQETMRQRYQTLVAAGDVDGAREIEEEMRTVAGKQRDANKKVLGFQVLRQVNDDAVDPAKNMKTMQDVLADLGKRQGMETDFNSSIVEAVNNALKTVETMPSNRGKGLEAAKEAPLLGGVGSFDPVTWLWRALLPQRTEGEINSKLLGWADDLVPGGVFDEDTPDQRLGKVVTMVAAEVAPLLKVEGKSEGEMKAQLISLLQAGQAATAAQGQERQSALGEVRKRTDELRSWGIPESTIKTVIGALDLGSQARESQRQLEKVGLGAGGGGKVKGDSPEDSRWAKMNESYRSMAKTLEEGTGLSYDRTAYVIGKDGKLAYTGGDLPATQLQSLFADWADGELSGQGESVLKSLGAKGEQLRSVMLPYIQQHLDHLQKVAEQNGIPIEEVMESQGPGMARKLKNIAAAYGLAHNEEGRLADQKEALLLGGELRQRSYTRKMADEFKKNSDLATQQFLGEQR